MVTDDEIEAARTPKGGWTRAQLEAWGVPWPPTKGWRDRITDPASKRRKAPPDEKARRIAQITALGYSVKELAPYHFRFEGKVDFWPSTFRWSDISGHGRRGTDGTGLESLIAYLGKVYPVNGARKRGTGLSGREARDMIAEIEAANEELIGDASREVPCDYGALVQQLYFCRTCRKIHERWETLRYLTRVSSEEPTKCVECTG